MKYNMSHSEMVAKLIKSGEVLKEQWSPRDCQLLHATTGIVGEFGELLAGIDYAVTQGTNLDMPNVREELGDLEFFLENFRTILNISRTDCLTHPTICMVPRSTLQCAAHMLIYSTDLMDHIKKHVIYRKELNREAVVTNLSKIEHILTYFRDKLSLTYDEILLVNMDKLAVRYKDFKYSDQQAQARADKA
jgi:NTP pyrophosphatase (non-canonical NTP hydrolase)